MGAQIKVRLHFPVLNLTRHYYNYYKKCGDVTFTLDPIEDCDYLVVVNRAAKDLRVRCSRDNVWLFFQEHGHRGMHRWMYYQHDDYGKIFTPHPIMGDDRYVPFYTPMAWIHKRSHHYLDQVRHHNLTKEEGLVAMWGKNIILAGHRKRSDFWDYLLTKKFDGNPLELYGRGYRPVADKWDIFKRYKYCLAIENAKVPGYWTEKIMDAFLSYTLPFYYGGEGVDNYFPPESFIPIDIDDKDAAYDTLIEAIRSDQWRERLDAIYEARRLVIHHHSFIPCIARLVNQYQSNRPKENLIVRKFI